MRSLVYDQLQPLTGSIAAGIASGAFAQMLGMPLYIKSLKGQMGTKVKSLDYRPSAAIIARGGLLGFCHLTVMHSVLGFLEQPLDPFGTRSENVDMKAKQFILTDNPVTEGDHLLNKLSKVGYFDQNRDPSIAFSEEGR